MPIFTEVAPPKSVPVLTEAEIRKIVISKTFGDRVVSALKGAVLGPVCVVGGALLSPFALFGLARDSFSGGSGSAAAVGNAAGKLLAACCVVSGVVLTATLLFGGPVGIGAILGIASCFGALMGYLPRVDQKATDAAQYPYWQAHHEIPAGTARR